MKVRKWQKLKKIFKKPFSSNFCSGRRECLSKDTTGKFLIKVRTVFNENPEAIEKKIQCFGEEIRKNPGHVERSFTIHEKKIPSKVQKLFVQCRNVEEKHEKCKNNSTKCPLDGYNSLLTTLSNFFRQKLKLFRSTAVSKWKKFWVFVLKKAFCLQNVPLDKFNAVLTTYWNYC